MGRVLRIVWTTLAAGTVITVLVVAAIPIWLLLRVPDAVESPEPDVW